MASHHYNLRSRSTKPTVSKRVDAASRARKAPRTAKPETPAAASSASPADTRLLYQNPRKWTLDHLRATNIQQEMDVPMERIVAAEYLPSYDETDFQRIAALFQDPAVEDMEPFPLSQFIGDFRNSFHRFFNKLRRFKIVGRLFLSDDNLFLLMDILSEIHPDQVLITKLLSRIPLSIRALKAGKGIWVDASIMRFSKEDDTMGIPLAVISRKHESGDLGIARYEIPQLLLQANMIFNYDETFEQYEAFVISLENYSFTFVKAIMSPEYLRSVRAGRPACGHLTVLRSRPLDITDRDTRQEFVRGVMALSRHLVQRPEFSFPMRKYRAVG